VDDFETGEYRHSSISMTPNSIEPKYSLEPPTQSQVLSKFQVPSHLVELCTSVIPTVGPECYSTGRAITKEEKAALPSSTRSKGAEATEVLPVRMPLSLNELMKTSMGMIERTKALGPGSSRLRIRGPCRNILEK
jgi:hypothetical protein